MLERRVPVKKGEVGVEPVGEVTPGWRVLLLQGNCVPVGFRYGSIGLAGAAEVMLLGLRTGLVGTVKVRDGDLSLASFTFLSFSETPFATAGCALTEMVGNTGCVFVGVAGVMFSNAAAYDFPVGNTGDAFAALGDFITSFFSIPLI